MLSGHSLVKSYGSSPALRGVSVELRRGEMLAVTGPRARASRRCCCASPACSTPDGGEVRFEGQRIDDQSETVRSRLRRGEFGVLFQFGQLVAEMTAVENVALPLLLGGARRREATAQARQWLARFGVEQLADQLPGQMSGGQSQRVAVARALVTEPAVLFADEPTGALDTVAGEQVMTELSRVARDMNTAVLLVTHDARVAAYGDRELVVATGARHEDLDAAAARHDRRALRRAADLDDRARRGGRRARAAVRADRRLDRCRRRPVLQRPARPEGLHTGVIVTFVLLCIPLLVFVGQCSRIGAPARDRRLAALRMAGATPSDVTRVAAAESGLAAAIGAVGGLVIYLVGRELLHT